MTYINEAFDLPHRFFDLNYLKRDYPSVYGNRSNFNIDLREIAESLQQEIVTEPSTSAEIFNKKNLFKVTPIQAADKKATIKASIATQYIGFGEGIAGSSTEIYRQQAGAFANTGNYSANDVIFVSIPGKRGNADVAKREQDKTINEAIKAVEAGAIILTDNKAYTESSTYNTGEQRLYKNMEAKGYNYSEIMVDGQLIGTWSKTTQPTEVTTTPAVEENLPIIDLKPKKINKNSRVFYSVTYDGLAERVGKTVIIPGFEDIQLMMEQGTKDVYEVTTGRIIDALGNTEAIRLNNIKDLFETRDIRTIIKNAKKIQTPKIDTTNQPKGVEVREQEGQKIISNEDLAYFKTYVDKSKGVLPKEFFTSKTRFKEFFNPETGKRESAPQSSKWILNSNNLYDLVDKDGGEVYISNVDLNTGIKYPNNPNNSLGFEEESCEIG
jgi:hypothetical protein